MKKVINTASRTVTFTFEGLDAVTLDLTKVSQANVTYASLHGMAARIGDAAALAKSAENKFIVTEAMRRAEVESMVKFYENGDNVDWNMRTGAPKAAPQNAVFLELAKKLGCTYDEAMARVAAMDVETLRAA